MFSKGPICWPGNRDLGRVTCRIERGVNSFCKYRHAIVFANTNMRLYLHGNLKANSIRLKQRVARGKSCDGQWGGIGQYVFVFVFASQDKTQKYRNTNTPRARREQRVGGGGGNGGHWGGAGRRRGHQSGMQLNSTMYYCTRPLGIPNQSGMQPNSTMY